MRDFVHLHLHSQFSILDSTISLPKLMQGLKEFDFDTVALTDFCNLYGAIDFYKEATNAKIKPIIGIELMLALNSRLDKKKQYGMASGYPLVLLAKDREGYQNLCKLSSQAFIDGFYYTPRIDTELLKNHHKGLICLTGSHSSRLAQLVVQDETDLAKQELHQLLEWFGEDLFLEVQRHTMPDERLNAEGIKKEAWLYQEYTNLIQKQDKIFQEYQKLSKEFSIGIVATNDVHYLKKEEWKAHEILLNVQSGEPCEIFELDASGNRRGKILNPKREVYPSHEYYLKSQDEMKELFKDCPEAISNTRLIADRCKMDVDTKTKFYPVFIPPEFEVNQHSDRERQKAAEQFLNDLCSENLKKRYTPERLCKVAEQYPGQDPMAVVKKRLEYELDIIISKGMCDYILIVYDFIFWAKSNKIPVGPGRGSGVGSIVLYLIGITDLEPLRFNLFFERFINPERLSYPDIDVDICMDRRQEVIDYTINKYGKEKVAQIITFGTMKAKMAIKDIGRVLSVPLVKVNEIAKAVPEDLSMTLEKALEVDLDFKQLYDQDDDAKRIIDLALQLEGSIRNTGIHAAGIIISGDPLIERIPVCVSKDSDMLVTQYSMKPVETVGMLKIDFLGLKTLTSIQKAVDAINSCNQEKVDWVNLSLEDKKTFELLTEGKTSGVFQLESSGMQELAKQLHIDKFEEIIAVGSLYRPGPMEMIPSFINRKHGKESIENDHPLMKDILKETYGIIVYQEQVMQIASKLAGYSLGEGDVLRRAMGKKDKAEMSKQGEKFCKGALLNGIDEKTAMVIFEKVEKFASYGFNKSHAAAYGFLSYVTAYLKANYTKEWMAALMTCDMVDITKVSKHIRECESLEIQILSPDINESKGEFIATNAGIRFALSAVKGVGEGVVEAIIEERVRNGLYQSLHDFIKRIDSKRVGKKIIHGLIEAGGFDYTQHTRAYLSAVLDLSYDSIAKQQKEKAKGILDLFDEAEAMPLSNQLDPKDFPEIPKLERLHREKELLGFYLTGHPLLELGEVIQKAGLTKIFSPTKDRMYAVKCACLIEIVEIKLSAKSSKKFAVIHITDGDDRYEVLLWSDILQEFQHLIVENGLIAGVFIVDQRDSQVKLQCRHLESLQALDDPSTARLQAQFERAKQLIQMELSKSKSNKFAAKERQEQMQKSKTLVCVCDGDLMRLSDVLSLKALFEEHAGKEKVRLEFLTQSKRVGSLEIDSLFGVDIDAQLIQALESLVFCKGIQVDET